MSRNVVATVLVVLGCLLAGPAVAAFALDQEITNQDEYLAAVTPLADDPVVRQAIAGQVTEAISERLGPGNLELPESARRIVDSSVTKVVESEAFRPAWVSINRVAHPRVLAMLRDEPGSLRIEDDVVLLDLGVVADEVKARLVADGVPLAERLPEVNASVPLFSRPAVRRAIPAFDTFEVLRVVLPIAVVALLASGLAISTRRRQTVIIAGVGIAVSMLLVLLYQWIARGQLVAASRSPELSGAFYDSLTGYLKTLLWLGFGIAAAVALAGVLARYRPGRTAPRS